MIEYIDIYDSNRQKTGKIIPRKGATLSEGEYQLYTISICQNWDGKFLITQRSSNKEWGAGWWEVSGGGVLSGEDSLTAAIRETREEVGLDVSLVKPELLYTYRNTDPKLHHNYFNDIYRFQFDFSEYDVTPQASETSGFRLATWEEILELNERGIFLHFARISAALQSHI